MTRCPVCGAPNPPSQATCYSCGDPLPGAATAPNAPSLAQIPPAPARRTRAGVAWAVILALLFAIGITAPVVAWYWKRPFPKRTFIVWNVLGSLDLVDAMTLGVLASASPVGILGGDVTTRLMGEFPLSLIPTFFVPLLLIFHLIALIRVR